MKEKNPSPKYVLAKGSQVRKEDFGLLFYTMEGPRLYFLSSGNLLDNSFFDGTLSIHEWFENNRKDSIEDSRIMDLSRSLDQLRDKGVVLEC